MYILTAVNKGVAGAGRPPSLLAQAACGQFGLNQLDRNVANYAVVERG